MASSGDRFQLSVSVFVIVMSRRQVLLLRRANTGWHDGSFSVPAGRIDGGEPLDAAAARELREETGLVVALPDLRLAHLLHCRTGDDGKEWLGAFLLAGRWTGTPALSEPHKHDAIGWFDLDALPETTIDYTRQGIRGAMSGEPFSTFGWRR